MLLGAVLVLFGFVSCGGDKPLPEKDFSYSMSDDGTGVKITKYNGKATKLIIPETIEGLPVVEVEHLVDRDTETGEVVENILGELVDEHVNDKVTKVVFPDTVRKIPSFYKFVALESVKLPASLVEEDTYNTVFPGTDESLKLCGFNFQYCKNLKELIIPEGITVIDCLGNCGLETLTLPSTIKEIKEMAFDGCSNLKELIIPDTIESICFKEDNRFVSFAIEYNYSFRGTNLDLETQGKLKQMGYNGSF